MRERKLIAEELGQLAQGVSEDEGFYTLNEDMVEFHSDSTELMFIGKLPLGAQQRKGLPIATGFVDYFPDAMIAVAELSRVGNEQHNPGKPLHWDRSKSGDESDALMRHFLERGTIDSDGIRHSVKVAWRAMALLQKELENA